MNYFAQGIQQGGEAGARGYLEKKKRDQDDRLNKARLEFEAAQLRENFKGQGELQKTRLDADAENARLGREFTTGRDATLNGYDDAKLNKTQGFQDRMRSEDRNANSRAAFTEQLARDAADMRRDFAERAKLQQNQRQFDAELAARNDPSTPDGIWKTTRAEQIRREWPRDNTDDPKAKGPAAAATPTIPPVPTGAIELLKKNPSMAPQFRAKYGVDPAQYLTN